jgi:signal transduction histidine kinase
VTSGACHNAEPGHYALHDSPISVGKRNATFGQYPAHVAGALVIPRRESDGDLDSALAREQFGLASVDGDLVVVERRGALAQWLPEPGANCCDCAFLFAMEATLEALKDAGSEPLILPSVRLKSPSNPRVTISIAWNAPTHRYVVVTAPDEGTKMLDRLLFQERREKQMLQQQAAAAADRLRISASLYRDIVESTGDAVVRLNPDLTISFLSGPAVAILALTPDRALGLSIRDILPLPIIDNPWRADMCVAGQSSFEQPARHGKGGTAWLWWNVRWLGDDGGPAEFQAVGREMTEMKRLRAELDKANQEAKLTAMAQERLRIAHDLHDTFIQSLVSLLAHLSLIRRGSADAGLNEELATAENDARAGLRAAREAVSSIRGELDWPGGPRPALEEAAQGLHSLLGANVKSPSLPKSPKRRRCRRPWWCGSRGRLFATSCCIRAPATSSFRWTAAPARSRCRSRMMASASIPRAAAMATMGLSACANRLASPEAFSRSIARRTKA